MLVGDVGMRLKHRTFWLGSVYIRIEHRIFNSTFSSLGLGDAPLCDSSQKFVAMQIRKVQKRQFEWAEEHAFGYTGALPQQTIWSPS